ncbi:hypothetical protein E1B28_004252 [Marasmius oreades]|uniref:Uncharacterized protein n=1 Tax=Marasmius oreades TaxID=181124 RepID=A0A9P7UY58_9AGAR|nr:uncharacterized protein E1B28_004252 [Marasmius oreades]KAG7096844.1 hypothetical protein E1B28_004252 [Marasmius oreades]
MEYKSGQLNGGEVASSTTVGQGAEEGNVECQNLTHMDPVIDEQMTVPLSAGKGAQA